MLILLRKFLPKKVHGYIRYVYTVLTLKSGKRARKAIGKIDDGWKKRIADVLASPDNYMISRCADAGKLQGYSITMHNGVKVCANGYYGDGILNMLIQNKGVHEPQEERVFEEVINCLPQECVMLELGAYWGFYSLSLLQKRPLARCYLVEPDAANLYCGKVNFVLNNRQGHFTQASVAEKPAQHPPAISVDAFCISHHKAHLHVLHADIQGYEGAMLAGAQKMLSSGKVDYVFISTHSNDLHYACMEQLQAWGYTIVAAANMEETFSVDGLICAQQNSLEAPGIIDISKK